MVLKARGSAALPSVCLMWLPELEESMSTFNVY